MVYKVEQNLLSFWNCTASLKRNNEFIKKLVWDGDNKSTQNNNEQV